VDHQASDRHILGAGIRDDDGTGVRPRALTEPGLLPGGATPHGALENVLGSAVPAFIVTDRASNGH